MTPLISQKAWPFGSLTTPVDLLSAYNSFLRSFEFWNEIFQRNNFPSTYLVNSYICP